MISSDNSDMLVCINDPHGTYEEFCDTVRSASAKKSTFILCNASSAVSDHEGISAAGVSPEARRLTPALDAEALLNGKTISAAQLPFSPKGIASPVVISRACLKLMDIQAIVIDCGSYFTPAVKTLKISDVVALCPSSGRAMPIDHVEYLYKKGQEIGRKMAEKNELLILSECVPGGTTTALALLTALGYDVHGTLSSSLPINNHNQRMELVEKGLSASQFPREQMRCDALSAVASVGDPMQAVMAGLAASASENIAVVLAGGSQMLAVWALMSALEAEFDEPLVTENLFVMTTGWVAFDPNAKIEKLAKLLEAPLAAARPNFNRSRHVGLQAYEQGNVKEGIGAGACLSLAHIRGFSDTEIMQAVDVCYEELAEQ